MTTPTRTRTLESAGIRCRAITRSSDFWMLEEAWRDLFQDCQYQTPLGSWEWAAEWWRHFGDCSDTSRSIQMLTITAHDKLGRCIGIAPFYYTKSDSPLDACILKPLGLPRTLAERNLQEEPMLLLRRGFESEAAAAIVRYLLGKTGSHRWDYCYLRVARQAAEAALYTTVREQNVFALPWRTETKFGQISALPPTWELFRKSLTKSMKDNTAYYPRLVVRHGHEWQLRIVRDQDEVEKEFATLVQLHKRRSTSTRGPRHVDHMSNALQVEFLGRFLSACASKGTGFLALLDIDGAPVAAQAFLEAGRTLTFYYSGYEPEWHTYSPVTILETEVIKDAISRGVECLNFLPGPQPWKTRWGAHDDMAMDRMYCIKPRPGSILRGALKVLRTRYGPKPETPPVAGDDEDTAE